MELLAALAIVAILLVLAWLWLSRNTPSIQGAVSGGGTPTRPVDRWLTAPGEIVVGEEAEFVFESQNNDPLSTGSQLSPISNLRVDFNVQPDAKLQILSIGSTAVNGATGHGLTGADGRITVKIKAVSLPDEERPLGLLMAVPAADTRRAQRAGFTVRAN